MLNKCETSSKCIYNYFRSCEKTVNGTHNRIKIYSTFKYIIFSTIEIIYMRAVSLF